MDIGSRKRLLRMIFFVIIILVLFVFLYSSLLRVDFFGRHFTFQVQFASIGNIKIGTPVKKLGIKIGYVQDIGINSNNNRTVLLTLSVDKKQMVQKGDKFRILATGILGDQYVDISPEDQLGVPVQQGDRLIGESSLGDPSGVAASVSDFLRNNQRNLEKILKNIETITHDFTFSLPDLRVALANFRDVSESMKKFTSQLNDEKGSISFLNRKETAQLIEATLKNIASFSTDLQKIGHALQVSLP